MLKEIKVSWFESTRKIEAQEPIAIGVWLERIKSGTFKDTIERIRAGESSWKTTLPTVAMHGLFSYERKKKDFIESSGLIILDIDDIPQEELEDYKQDIMDTFPCAYAAMVSPSGNGIKVLYRVDESQINGDSYNYICREVVKTFEIYGDVDFLSITDCLIVTYDPNILINEECEVDWITVAPTEKIEGELEELDPNAELWDDAHEFYVTVLMNDIAAKTNNNYHFIQVSILDLKKFGFEHPKEDLSFVIDYAEDTFKRSADNKKRFLEAVEVAKNYPQLKWPVRMIHEDDYEPADYSQYTEEVPNAEVPSEKEQNDLEGMVDYTDFFDKVVGVVEEGDRVGFEISLENFADSFRPKGTGICTVTGIPSHGKTEFLDQMTVDFARLYGHETLIAGFEQTPEEHVVKLIRRILGKDVRHPSWWNEDNKPRFRAAYDFIVQHFQHVDTTNVGGNVDVLLEILAKKIHERRAAGGDPKWIVIDPFNMLTVQGKYSKLEKIEEAIRRITHFSHQMGVLVFLVAHPTKMQKDEKTGEFAVPDFYSVKGSSAFYEMSYHGFVVYRMGGTKVMVRILKVKQNNMGERGIDTFYDYIKGSGRYVPLDESDNELAGDHRKDDWLEKALETIKQIQNEKR